MIASEQAPKPKQRPPEWRKQIKPDDYIVAGLGFRNEPVSMLDPAYEENKVRKHEISEWEFRYQERLAILINGTRVPMKHEIDLAREEAFTAVEKLEAEELREKSLPDSSDK